MFLQDKAAIWVQPLKNKIINGTRTTCTTQWTAFFDEFKAAFHNPDEKASAMRTLTNLKQKVAATTYTMEFWELMTTLEWTENKHLKYHYYKGLKPELKNELAKVDAPAAIHNYICLVEKIDNWIWACKQERKEEGSSGPAHRPQPRREPAPTTAPMLNITTNDPIPMDIGAAVSTQ